MALDDPGAIGNSKDVAFAAGKQGRDIPAMTIALPDAEIHIWRASLDDYAAHLHRLAAVLSAEEQARAERFHFEQDRHRFIVGRGLLRVILGRYLGLKPARVQFCYGQRGKPRLAEGLVDSGIQFNVAHARQVALYALVRGHAIGVDLEYVRDLPDLDHIAARFFSERENAARLALPAEQRLLGFYNCWTRKEAYIKAIGEGLTCPLDQFDVSLIPGEPVRLLGIAGDAEAADRWSLWALKPAPGYVGALAAALSYADRERYRLQAFAQPLL
jgi:4'-phosphopantetheinyl transferase